MVFFLACTPSPSDTSPEKTPTEDSAEDSAEDTEVVTTDTGPIATLTMRVEGEFAGVPVGCSVEGVLTVENLGPERVSDAELDVTLSDDAISGLKDAAFDLDVGELWTASILFEPQDDADSTAVVELSANDVAVPEPLSITATGTLEPEVVERFVEDGVPVTRQLLVVLDTSGSMEEEVGVVAGIVGPMLAELVDVDYTIAVITGASATLVGPAVTPGLPDPAGALEEQLSFVPDGDLDFSGSEWARSCLDGGGCADLGFSDASAALEILYITDGADYSEDDSGWAWDEYVAWFEDAHPAEGVTISAIAGDYPTGCATGEPGVGVYEQTLATEGLYLSICASDFADYGAYIGEELREHHSTFWLSDEPIEHTIIVTVDGVTYTWDWRYDADDVAIRFDPALSEGSEVVVTYHPMPETCP